MNDLTEALKRYSPAILTALAALGTIGTAVLAARETPKALSRLRRVETEDGTRPRGAKAALVAGPAYLPAIGLGLSTIACMAGAHVLNVRQQASLAAAYALLDGLHREYRDKAAGIFGEQADRTIVKAMEEARKNAEEDRPAFDEKQIFFEQNRGEFFERTMEEVFEAEYHINRNLALRGCVTLNEFYDFLRLEHIENGDEIGWDRYEGEDTYGYAWIDFEHRYFETDDGLTVCAIAMPFPPHPREEC